MALDFPNSPADGATYVAPNGTTYVFHASPSPGFWSVSAAGSTGGVAAPTYDEYKTWDNRTGVIPLADTLPLVTQGKQIFVRSFTALNGAHRIRVKAGGSITMGALDSSIVALFVDNVCVRSMYWVCPAANYVAELFMAWEGVVGAGAHAYELRVGGAAGVAILNGGSTQRELGGSLAWTMSIEELLAP